MESREREKEDWKEKRENGEHMEVKFFGGKRETISWG